MPKIGYQVLPKSWKARESFRTKTGIKKSTLGFKHKKRPASSATSSSGTKPSAKRARVGRAIQDGPAGSISYSAYANDPLTLPKGLCKNYRVTNGAGQITTTPGVQTAKLLLSLFNNTDVLAQNGITGNTNGRAFMLSAHAEVMLTNASNASARVTIYDVIAKRDISSATITDPVTAWTQGLADEGGGSAAIPCAQPFSSKSFTQMYKVVKKTDMLMAQGTSHQHFIDFSANKAIDWGIADYAQQYHDLTWHTFVVVHGQVDDAVTGGAGASIGSSKVNYAMSKQITTTFLSDNTTSYNATNTLPTAAFGGGENLIYYV